MEHSARVNVGETFQGSLFSGGLLSETIAGSTDWLTLDDAALDDFEASFRALFDRFPTADFPNESQTEDDLIWPVLDRLGWTASLRQQNLPARLHWARYAGRNFTDRQRIKRKADNWSQRYAALPVPERLAVLGAMMAVEAER